MGGGQVRGQDHVTSDKDHVTTGEDQINSEVNHMTSDKDHVTTVQDHVTAENDHVTAEKDHVTVEDRETRLLTDDTHDSRNESHDDCDIINNDVINDGGVSYDATKELDEILSKSDLVDGSFLPSDHSIGVMKTQLPQKASHEQETHPPQEASHDQETQPPQKASHDEESPDNSKAHKKSDSLDVAGTPNSNKSPSPMSDSVSMCSVCVVCLCVSSGVARLLLLRQSHLPVQHTNKFPYSYLTIFWKTVIFGSRVLMK